MRTFVIGDIHGFDYNNDYLICLGDVCDGWPETKESIDKLLTIKNLTYIFGNHDFWTLEWMREGVGDEIWLDQGGAATVKSYSDGVPPSHIEFLEQAKHYLILKTKLFVHAGIALGVSMERQSPQVMLWDRQMAQMAMTVHVRNAHANLTGFDEVYIGHTPITPPPKRMCEVWFMDTGAGWSGVLSMMDIDTKEVFMSDPVPGLYPGVRGRSRR